MKIRTLPELTEVEKGRFWSKVDIRGEDECWEWIASYSNGYGQFAITRDGKQVRTTSQRFALFISSGEQEDVARHKCDNPKCCNPKHLEWGSQQDNIDDMFSRGRGNKAKGEELPHSVLKADDINPIRLMNRAGKSLLEIAKLFNVSKMTIWRVVNKQTWNHIDET